MNRLAGTWSRLISLFRRDHSEDDFREELEAHVEFHTEDGVRAGLTREVARRQALIRLGGAEQTRQAYRERATLPWLEVLVRDVRYSLRTLIRHPSVTAIAILSISLGVGANSTVFSMVSRFVLQRAPVGDPKTLFALYSTQDGDGCCNSFSPPRIDDVREQAKSFAGVAAYYDLMPASMRGGGEPERVWGQAVTTNFFDVTALPMAAGRGFAGNEDKQPVVVLSEELWKREFHGEAETAGRPVQLSGHTYTVVGVARAPFHGVDQMLLAQFWVPMGKLKEFVPGLPPEDARHASWLQVVARLRPGVTEKDAQAELAAIGGRLAAEHPETDAGLKFVFEPAGTLAPRNRSTVNMFLAALMAVVILVLAIAGANVANLMFAQAVARQREMAVRIALGSTRASLQRRLMTESVIVGLGGGILGVALALVATRGLAAFHVPAPVPLNLALAVDWRVALFSFIVSVACGVLLGWGPAIAASRPAVARALKGEDGLAKPGRRVSLRDILVVGQVAMALVLVSMTGLFLHSLERAARIQIGFDPRNLLMLSVDPRLSGYTPERTVAFLEQMQKAARELPGVVDAVVTDVPLLSGGNRSDGFSAAGDTTKTTTADLYMVAPGFFRTLGIPLLAGRDFGNEAANAPSVAVVNRRFAELVFGGANPIGRVVNGPSGALEIVGVVGDSKSRTIGEEPRAILYRSLRRGVANDPSVMGYTLVVRTQSDPAALSVPLRRAVQGLDPAIAVYNEETMAEHVRTAYFLPRLAATLFSVFGTMGLVLAVVGLYGVMSYSVSRRTREIGIRMALGAQATTVHHMILQQGLRLVLIAVVLGWPTAWMLARLAASFLYGVEPHDELTFAGVPPLLVLIGLAACWIPARRAALTDPMQTLRTE